jgi:type VI secretion system protein ImpF
MRVMNNLKFSPSLLDKLTDDEPTHAKDTLNVNQPSYQEFKQSLQRDLQAFFNSPRTFLTWPEHWQELSNSLLNYGIADFSRCSVAAEYSYERFRQQLEQALTLAETRLQNIRVIIEESNKNSTHTIYLRIEAMVYCEPHYQEVIVRSSIDPLTGKFSLKDESDG